MLNLQELIYEYATVWEKLFHPLTSFCIDSHMRQPLFPTLLDCAHFVSTTSVSTPSRSRTRLLLHIWVVIRLVTTNLDFPHFVCAHSVTHIFVACSTQSNRAHSLYYTFRFNTANPPHPVLAQLDCARKLGRYNSHKYLTRVR